MTKNEEFKVFLESLKIDDKLLNVINEALDTLTEGNAVVPDRHQPLTFNTIVSKGDLKFVQFALETATADIPTIDKDTLRVACETGNAELVNYLIDNGARYGKVIG